MLTAAVTKAPILELLKADTALSQDAWLEEEAKKGRSIQVPSFREAPDHPSVSFRVVDHGLPCT
ncbi:hypothetical protein [Bradyrhizobium algeriense]|uniref:hypothetical protein n=1 Tax=Bradyrhizobium algeriense TaxID=634784 RepID=UPI0011AEB296|nr:hypothetical protein [Bradyrhizobium algeriense]